MDWREPARTDVPTLLVRARTPLGPDMPATTDLPWTYSSRVTAVDVPGDHFSMMGARSDTTARAVADWLAAGYGDDARPPQGTVTRPQTGAATPDGASHGN